MAQNKTPLRYPGGKQKLTPFVLEIIRANGLEGGHYVEPYAGGAGVAMELLVAGHVNQIHLNDSSLPIYALWNSILTHTEEFCRRISRALLNVEEWKDYREIMRNPNDHSELDVGFATFYLNRTNRSGVLSAGVIGGLDQAGKWKIDARFPRNELIRRIELIGGFRDSITLLNLDAEQIITDYIPTLPENTLTYCDPPYFEKASKLYLNHYAPNDHERIAGIIQQQRDKKWIVSYDGVAQILGYYANRRKFLYELQYNAARAYKGNEVFIFSDNLVVPRNSVLPHIAVALKANTRKLHQPAEIARLITRAARLDNLRQTNKNLSRAV
ncbi:DNA adenine methylase [Solimicrobium silvestre]|uniref:site-specific DNA-methyltransferase (adenine-specific) n=1 Tax=Solimicrobium silvestre TaxID=2099400 RepID=A0A2S9GZE4_9BURK|nr:DNA adenine methylase [Solimicrobium silvestre]PRC93109.1 D12 class N6 adenine-specific DNA methyltransferase [Solimicrobium silvestre]